MKLDLEQIKSITLGAVRITKEEGCYRFYRFTEEQAALLVGRNSFYEISQATSGIKFRFRTNSKLFYIKGDLEYVTSRRFFSFDLFVNGEMKENLDQFSHSRGELFGSFEKKFELGEGEKEVLLYFPWNAKVFMKEVSLDDGAFIDPVKPEKKMLCFGDSITQGYDADFSSNSYVSRLARKIGMEEVNKGIGGEIFFPPMAAEKDDFTPEIITVAYGTNDWNCETLEQYEEKSGSFYKNLSKSYPQSKIFAITPIWRKACMDEKPFGPFENTHLVIEKVTKDLKNVTVIRGFDFVPKEEKYFADKSLHPNDEGFFYQAEALYQEMKKYL